MLPREASDLGHRLEDARLVVHRLERDETHGLARERELRIVEIDRTVRRHTQPHDAGKPFGLERLGDPRDGGVLHAARDERRGPGGLDRIERRAEREVVGLGPARGEDDVARVDLRERSHRLASVFDAGPGGATVRMDAGRVAPGVRGRGGHGDDRLGQGRGGRVPVEVDAHRWRRRYVKLVSRTTVGARFATVNANTAPGKN